MSELARVDFAVMADEAQRRKDATTPSIEEAPLQEVGRQEVSHQEVSHLRAGSPAGNKSEIRQPDGKPAGRTPRPADFNALVRPLEDLHPAWRLREPGLGWCLVMHHEDPEKFQLCVDYAIEGWNEGSSGKPLGLLCELAREWLEEDDE